MKCKKIIKLMFRYPVATMSIDLLVRLATIYFSTDWTVRFISYYFVVEFVYIATDDNNIIIVMSSFQWNVCHVISVFT